MIDAVASAPQGDHSAPQRRGESALTTHLGLRAAAIIVRADALERADALIAAVNGFAEAMREEALLQAGEYAPEALGSWCAHDYFSQVLAGGHGQYWANRGGDGVALAAAAQALHSIGAAAYGEVLATLTRLMARDRQAQRALLKQKRWKSVADGLRALDDKVRDLAQADPLPPKHDAWLRGLQNLRAVDEAEALRFRASYGTLNPLLEQRRAELAARHAAREQTEPTYAAVRALTDMARLRFLKLGDGASAPMRTIWPEGPDRRGFVRWVQTDQGPCAAVFYWEGRLLKRYLAVLLEQNGVLPLGSLRLTREDYHAITPAYARR